MSDEIVLSDASSTAIFKFNAERIKKSIFDILFYFICDSWFDTRVADII